jgi:pimeloyl-ACP methyl ester carboxylesterase
VIGIIKMKSTAIKYLILTSIVVALLGCSEKQDRTVEEKEAKLKTGYISVGKTKLYYQEMGTGQPVILLHPTLLNHTIWDDQFERFARDFRTIRYDLRGHGLSLSVADTFSHHQDLFKLINELYLDRAILVGLSFGASVAIDFALEYPEKVKALVLVSPKVSGYEFREMDYLEDAGRLGLAYQEGNLELVIEMFKKIWIDGPERNSGGVDPAVREKIGVIVRENLQHRNPQSIAKSLDPPALARSFRLELPALIIVGNLDMTDVKTISTILERDIDGSQRIIMDNVGHIPNMENPAEFNQIVLDFLSSL